MVRDHRLSFQSNTSKQQSQRSEFMKYSSNSVYASTAQMDHLRWIVPFILVIWFCLLAYWLGYSHLSWAL
jgi:hypothetical protein